MTYDPAAALARFREKWDANGFALESEEFDLGEYTDPEKFQSFIETELLLSFKEGEAAARAKTSQYRQAYQDGYKEGGEAEYKRGREDAVDAWIREHKPITDFRCSEHDNPTPTCLTCSEQAVAEERARLRESVAGLREKLVYPRGEEPAVEQIVKDAYYEAALVNVLQILQDPRRGGENWNEQQRQQKPHTLLDEQANQSH